MKRVAVLLVLGILPRAALYAGEQTAPTTFRVSASVEAACQVTATDLDFSANTAQAGGPLQGTTLLQATCTPDSSYNIRLNEGVSPGATGYQRRMVPGTNALNDRLYSDAQRNAVWGNATGTVNGVGTGLSQEHTIFGAVPAAQVIPAGGYADTTTVRIYY